MSSVFVLSVTHQATRSGQQTQIKHSLLIHAIKIKQALDVIPIKDPVG